ncbi:unnamed protein product [Arabidopsis halleri]
MIKPTVETIESHQQQRNTAQPDPIEQLKSTSHHELTGNATKPCKRSTTAAKPNQKRLHSPPGREPPQNSNKEAAPRTETSPSSSRTIESNT